MWRSPPYFDDTAVAAGGAMRVTRFGLTGVFGAEDLLKAADDGPGRAPRGRTARSATLRSGPAEGPSTCGGSVCSAARPRRT